MVLEVGLKGLRDVPEGSLTLRVKVLGIEGLRSIPLDLEVSAERPAW